MILLTPILTTLGARAKITEYEANLDVISKQENGGIEYITEFVVIFINSFILNSTCDLFTLSLTTISRIY